MVCQFKGILDSIVHDKAFSILQALSDTPTFSVLYQRAEQTSTITLRYVC